jgi:hypothetical protein
VRSGENFTAWFSPGSALPVEGAVARVSGDEVGVWNELRAAAADGDVGVVVKREHAPHFVG